MVSEESVLTQRDVFLLPLLVQGFSTPLQKDPLEGDKRTQKQHVFLVYFVVEAAPPFHGTTPPHKHTLFCFCGCSSINIDNNHPGNTSHTFIMRFRAFSRRFYPKRLTAKNIFQKKEKLHYISVGTGRMFIETSAKR